MKRLHWIDTLKLLAMLVIMAVHFLDMLWPEGLEAYAGTVFVRYFSGKSMVALFTVILGYFAAKPRNTGVISYTLRRYVQFAFYAFTVTAALIVGSYGAVWLFHTPDSYAQRIISDGFQYNVIYLLRDSFLFECNYIDTYWCLGPFVTAGALCCFMGKYGGRLPMPVRIAIPSALIGCAFLTGSSYLSWIALGLMGYILRTLTCTFTLNRKWAAVIIAVSVLLLTYPIDECVTLYYIQGLAALGVLTGLFYLPELQRALSLGRLSGAGEKIIGLFMTHVPILSLLRSTVFPMLEPAAGRALCAVLYVPLAFFASGILAWMYRPVGKVFSGRKVKI